MPRPATMVACIALEIHANTATVIRALEEAAQMPILKAELGLDRWLEAP